MNEVFRGHYSHRRGTGGSVALRGARKGFTGRPWLRISSEGALSAMDGAELLSFSVTQFPRL